MIWLAITWIPSWTEGWLDRKGESKRGKIKDTIWLLVVAIGIAGGAWWFGQNPLAIIGLLGVWRVCTFDYIVNWFLKQRENHRHINIWCYTGTSTYWWDQLLDRVPCVVVISVRLVVLLVYLGFYILKSSPWIQGYLA